MLVGKALNGRKAVPVALVTPASAFMAAAIALVGLVLHWREAEGAGGIVPGFPRMVPAIAVGVLLLAIALLLVRPARGVATRTAGCVAAAVSVAFGLVVIGRQATGWHIGAMPCSIIAGGEWWAQRPGTAASLGLAFMGASLLALGISHRRIRRWADLAAAATLMIALTALVGHAYGASVLYSGGMAVSTAVTLTALALGALFADPSRGLAAISASNSAGGYLLRRLTPAALLAPLLLGWLALMAQRIGLFGTAFATALLVVSLIVLLVGLIVFLAKILYAVDAEREGLLLREREAREQVTNILESITDAFFAVDREWRFTYVNREAERLLRRPREELVGRNLWEEFPEAVGASFEREYQRAMKEQVTVHFEEYYEPLKIWVDVRAFPAADGLSIYFHDVTTRKHTEERIRESEARFRALAENATMAIFVINEESRIEFANPAVERIFGHAVPEMLGRSLDMLMPEDQRPLHDAGIRRYRETGRRNLSWESVELPGLTKDGRIIPLEISMGEFVRDGQHYFTGIARDITERKQAEEALRESEGRYRLLADMIPQHIWITEPDGYHSYFSRRWYEFTGTTPGQTQGEGWLALLHPQDREPTMARWQHSLQTGEPYAVEYRFRGADGNYSWFLGQAMPLRNEAGEIVRWFGTLTDISERKQLDQEREQLFRKEQEARADAERRREELERVTESRARLMRGFSHDVRNPLSVADGNAWLLEDGKVLGELSGKQRESVQKIRRAIHTSLRLIDDLLELARTEAGQIDLECVRTDISETAREVAGDFEAQAEAVGLTLEVRVPEGLQVNTDPVRLRQILANLLSNAVKYAPKGQVMVDANILASGGPQPGDWIAVRVIDTGPGIPRDKWEVIFQEYTRLDPGAQHGAGIGLAISRRIARLLGGDLTVESEVDRGSTFILWLPLANSQGD